MRILPLGDEIVLGDGASGGFRDPLEKLLLNAGIQFEFVGSRSENSFEMKMPFHEGWRGIGLTALREDRLATAMSFEPDLVLLYAGASDVRSLPDPGIAIARLDKLIREILTVRPESKVICSQLIQSKDYQFEQRVKTFNRGLGTLIETLAKKGFAVSRVKMHAKVKADSLNESGVPNEAGYVGMAEVWFRAIDEISRNNAFIIS